MTALVQKVQTIIDITSVISIDTVVDMGASESQSFAGVFSGDSQKDEAAHRFLTPDFLERTWLDLDPSPDLDMPWEKDLGKHFLQQAILCQLSAKMETVGLSSKSATGIAGEACKGAETSFCCRPLETNCCEHRGNLLERGSRGKNGCCFEKMV